MCDDFFVTDVINSKPKQNLSYSKKKVRSTLEFQIHTRIGPNDCVGGINFR